MVYLETMSSSNTLDFKRYFIIEKTVSNDLHYSTF